MQLANEVSEAERDLRTTALALNSLVKLNREMLDNQKRITPPRSAFAFSGDADFVASLRNSVVGHQIDHRLIHNSVSIFGGGDGASGGYAVPNQHVGVLASVAAPTALLMRFNPIPVTSPLVRAAVDNEPDWSSQIDASMYGPGDVISASVPKLSLVSAVVSKVAALIHVSEELALDGGVPFYNYIAGLLGRRLRYSAEYLLMQGTGQDQPLGALNAPSLVVVAKEGSQTASTIVAANVVKMVARLAPGGFDRAFWAAHSSTLPQLMALGTVYGGSSPDAPYGTILGRPIVITEAANVLGAQGDLTLIDPAGWLVAVAGPNLAQTIEFAFDQSLKSVRGTMYFASVPLLGAAVARRTGGDVLSHTVALAVRS